MIAYLDRSRYNYAHIKFLVIKFRLSCFKLIIILIKLLKYFKLYNVIKLFYNNKYL